MKATVAETREVAQGTLMVVFDLAEDEVDFQPGQYFFVNLLDPPYEDERGPRRHFSVVTSPNERSRLGFCTRLRDTGFKKSIQELEVGDEADVEPPKGSFLLPDDTSQELVFIAGGIGITVFRCMLRYIAEEGLPYRITFFFSNRNRAEAAFLDELEELEGQIEGLTVVLTMTDDPEWTGETRRFDADFFREHLGERFDEVTFMIAGPPAMATAMKDSLLAAGVAEDRVRPDNFSGY